MSYGIDRPKRDVIIGYILGALTTDPQRKTNTVYDNELNEHLKKYNEPPITEKEEEIVSLLDLMESTCWYGEGGNKASKQWRQIYSKTRRLQ